MDRALILCNLMFKENLTPNLQEEFFSYDMHFINYVHIDSIDF